MWEAIAYVSSGVTLAAFLGAVAAWIYSKKSEEKARLIETAPESERAQLVQSALEFFHVDTGALTREQRYQLAITQITARADRSRASTMVVIIIAILAAAVTAYAISRVPAPEKSTKALASSATPTPVLPTEAPNVVPEEVKNFAHVRIGASKRAIEARLGPPTRELLGVNLEGAEYLFDTYYLRLIYELPGARVGMYLAAARTDAFTPELPLLGDVELKLGSFNFRDISGCAKIVNTGQRSGFTYAESVDGFEVDLEANFNLIYSSAAYSFGDDVDFIGLACQADEQCSVAGFDAEGVVDQECHRQWEKFRVEARPNAFSVGSIPEDALSNEGEQFGPFNRWADPYDFSEMWVREILRGVKSDA